MLQVQAQRGPRTDVGTLPDATGLANAINSWLDLHPDLPVTHGNEFTAIHSLPNFFPWHRAHIRELEEALGSLPEDPSLLPGWRPRAGVGEPSNDMPAPLRLTNGTPQLPGMPNPGPLVSIPSTIDLPSASCISVDEFGSIVQDEYHDAVHSAVGGIFLDQAASATVLGFWPWHAWVDEFWYNWEKYCTTGYDYFPPTGSTEIIINSEVTWTGERFVKGKIIIENGGRLNIAPDAVIHFRSSDYESYETSILVKPGGLLYVDDATLTGIDQFGSGVGGTGGIQYHSGWKGIFVEGTGMAGGGHGQVSVINNSVIEHAAVGIESVKGGRVVATNSDFLNNRISIYIHDYSAVTPYGHFYIANCDFDVLDSLRDVTWKPFGNLPSRHFLHKTPQIPNKFIKLEKISNAQIIGGTFKRSFSDAGSGPDIDDGERMTSGIEAIDARFSCTAGADFAATLDFGIFATGSVSGILSGPTVRGCTFNSRTGILLNGVNYVTIASNTFTNAEYGVSASFASSYDISDNTFNGSNNVGAACILSQDASASYANIIEQNAFTGGERQIQFQFANPNVQFKCNTFNSPGLHSVALTSGGLPPQGSCLSEPAGNLWDFCINPESHLFKNQGASGYTYSAHSDRMPVCVSPDITVTPCTYNYMMIPSCEVTPPCNPCEDFPEETEIATREAQKQFWASSTLPPEDIADIVWQLTWEQKIIAQRGLARVVEEDPTLETAFEYLDAVGAVFPFPTYDRIGLYLSSGDLSAANNLIATLPAGNEKILLSLFSTLSAEGRSFKQITAAEEQTVRNIALGSDQAAARAKSILFAAFGESIVIESEPLDGGGRPASELTETESPSVVASALSFVPNPRSEITTVRYVLDGTGQQAAVFTLTDIYGRQVLSQQLFVDAPTGEIKLNLRDLPVGIYVGTMTVDGQRRAVSKLTVTK